MSQLPVTEAPETRIEEPEGSLDELARANTREAIDKVVARWPSCLAAWAAEGELALAEGRSVEAYAFFRVGYHRGLDRLRAAGWRGSGRVPWAHTGNQGFLRSLAGLARAAERLGEQDEASRCRDFLSTLAPEAGDVERP